ncbi:MAG: ArnT family glycosyltransferase, partial [Polyangiales bacterium]
TVALALIGAVIVFVGLGKGMLEIYDEGLYGMYGRTTLHFDTWLHVVTPYGQYPTGQVKFSKPPLSVWLVAESFLALGPSLFALRLPFAIATWLTALIALAYGRLLDSGPRGTWLGFAWGIFWLLSHGAHHYGRTATIEALLVCFVLGALYAHSRARRASSGEGRLLWAAAAGFAIAAAFMTKQLVCAIAAVPIAMVELWTLRRERFATVAARALPALGVPLAVAVIWLLRLYLKVRSAAVEVLWDHAIVSRVYGFDGTHHQNYLNRIAEQLDLDAAPLSWPLCALGLALLLWLPAGEREPTSEPSFDPAAGWLLGLSLVCSFLAFDVGSRAILPWYVLSFLPPLVLGQAFLVSRAFDAARTGGAGRVSQIAAAGGAAALVTAASASVRNLTSSFAVSLLAAGAIAWSVQQWPVPPRRLFGIAAALAVLLLAGNFARPAYRASETEPMSVLGLALHRLHARRIAVDEHMELHSYTRNTFFGVASEDTQPPWLQRRKQRNPFDSWVQSGVLPVELHARSGVHVLRAGGTYAFFGDLTAPPYDDREMARILARGPITFEAEQMSSERDFTRRWDPNASAHAIREVEPRLWEKAEEFLLARGLTPALPAGRYVAAFFVRYRCQGLGGEWPGNVSVRPRGRSPRTASLSCGARSSRYAHEFQPLIVSFELTSASPVELALDYVQGAVAFDRVTIGRAPPGKR